MVLINIPLPSPPHLQHSLPYPLCADVGGKVREAYGVPKSLGLIDGRVTFVIDKGGVVRSVFNSQINTGGHVSEARKAVAQLVEAEKLGYAS